MKLNRHFPFLGTELPRQTPPARTTTTLPPMACPSPSHPSSPTQRKNLKCGICQDVFKSPKLLPCFHTFCCKCLEQLVKLKGSPFQCPSCRSLTHVPAGGAGKFQTNMYISDNELERARENLMLCRVHVNYDEPLTFFCVTCDDAICLRCKLTRHEGHRCEDLTKADERSKRLAGAKRELDDVIDDVEGKMKAADEQLNHIQRKKAMIVQQVHARHDSLVAMVDRWRNSALKDLDRSTEIIEAGVSSEKDILATHLSTCCTQRKRVQHVMDNLSEDTLDVADAERVLRTCSETESLRKQLKVPSSPSAILRPGIHCSLNSLREDDIRRYIGVATVLKLTTSGPAKEVLSKFYQCLEDGKPRQVLALCVTNDGSVDCLYEHVSPGGTQWGKRTISPNAQATRDNKVKQMFLFRKFSSGEKFCVAHHKVDDKIYLNSKSGSLAQIQYVAPSSTNAGSCTVSDIRVVDDPVLNHPKQLSDQVIQSICTAGRPLAFDVSADGSILAVVEEVTEKAVEGMDQTHVSQSPRMVRLYRRGQEECITTYQNPYPNFLPTDVCFWRCGGKEKLLVGDYANDSVHIINVFLINAHKGRCVLERYLAAGHGDLAKPTAFDTDGQGRLWIGTANGWILKCEVPAGSLDEDDDDDHEALQRNGEVLSGGQCD